MYPSTPSSTPRPALFGATAYGLTGTRPAMAIETDDFAMPGLERSAGPGLTGEHAPPWHPESPLFWFGMLAAVTLGLIAASTSVRIGPFRASAAAGHNP